MPRRVFITVAEVSGDQHAAELINSLKQLDPDLVVEGIGGPMMAAAGAHIHHETTRNAAMSVHAVGRVVEVLKLLRWTREHFEQNRPDLHICVDSPAMNLHFAKLAHRMGVPVMYYIAPQLWAWREGRMKKLKKWVDRVACILPFEEEYFSAPRRARDIRRAPAVRRAAPKSRHARSVRAIPQRPPAIGLLAGSRASEAKANFPPMLDVAERVLAEFPQATFCSPTTEATHPIVSAEVARRGLPVTIERDAFDAMVPRCDLCVTVSGTATLHVAGWGVPMIVVYRVNRLLWQLLGRWIVKTRHVFAGEPACRRARAHRAGVYPVARVQRARCVARAGDAAQAADSGTAARRAATTAAHARPPRRVHERREARFGDDGRRADDGRLSYFTFVSLSSPSFVSSLALTSTS
jgi:lipid-A-disaccharide synthase